MNHIKQVAGGSQAAQINLLRHQHTELPAGKYKKEKSSAKSRQSSYKQHGSESSKVQSQHKKHKKAPFKSRKPKVHQLQAGAVYAKDSAICNQTEDDSSSEDAFCLQVKVKHTQANLQRIPRPTHLITNLAYRLKPQHTRNLYLRA